MDIFVARQPIFDRRLNVFGYELLFRSGLENYFENNNGDQATLDVITNSFFYIGLEELTGQKKVFINYTYNLIKEGVPSLFPNELMIVEILEHVEPTREILQICQNLRKAGYILALDDFILTDQKNPLMEVVDIIKVDFKKNSVSKQQTLPEKLRKKKVKLLAEKVETPEEFKRARQAGYSYFQGYFFSKPIVRTGKAIPTYKLTYLEMLQHVNSNNIEFSEMEEMIKQDVSMTYKLLRFINSAYVGVIDEVNSIKRALILLGINEVKKWVAFLAMDNMAQDKPDELIRTSLMRARLCEGIAEKIELTDIAAEAFLMGMFTVIDAIMDKPKHEILSHLSLPEEIIEALQGEKNLYGKILDIVSHYESGNWDQLSKDANALQFPENEMPVLYEETLKWTDQIFAVKYNR